MYPNRAKISAPSNGMLPPLLTKPSTGIVVKTPNGGRVVLVWAEGPRAGITNHAPSP